MEFFEELPRLKRRPGRITDWAAAKQSLIDNEGQWGLIIANASSATAQQLRMGRNACFRGDELENFEFAMSRPENADYPRGRSDLYGRYTKP